MNNLLDLCAQGYWFCKGCHSPTTIEEDPRGGSRCERCRSPRIEYHPPALQDDGESRRLDTEPTP